jgi:nitrite reductase/ring-hydroxylating ferredoxin subunit
MKKNNLQLICAFVFTIGCSALYAQAAFPTINVNLNYPQFQKLKLDRGFVYLDGGLKGLILYRASENSYLAFDRACPHNPNGEVVQVDLSSLFMIDHACHSSFNFSDGQPTGGPAQRPLVQYRVDQEGTVLKISDEIIN